MKDVSVALSAIVGVLAMVTLFYFLSYWLFIDAVAAYRAGDLDGAVWYAMGGAIFFRGFGFKGKKS